MELVAGEGSGPQSFDLGNRVVGLAIYKRALR